MKRILHFAKIFVVFLTPFLLPSLAKGDPPINHNWTNSMVMEPTPQGSSMCVVLQPDFLLYINLYVYIAQDNVNGALPMQFQYTLSVPNYPNITAFTPIVTNSMLQLVTLPSGLTAYRAKFAIPVNCTQYCGAQNETGPMPYSFDFTLIYQLVTPNAQSPNGYLPYPIGQYPNLWPSNRFDVPSPAYVDVLHHDTHPICCPISQRMTLYDDGTNMNIQEAEQFDDFHKTTSSDLTELPDSNNQFPNPSANVVTDIKVSPNPVNNLLKVNLQIEKPSDIIFEYLDYQGRLVQTYTEREVSSGRQEFNLDFASIQPGVYYLRISTAEWSKVVRIVKAS